MSAAIAPVAGAVAGGIMNKNTKPQSTQTTNEPWEGVQPYLLDLYGQASDLGNWQMGNMPSVPQVPGSLPAPPSYMAQAPQAQYFPYATTTAYAPDRNTLTGLQSQLDYASGSLPNMGTAQHQGYYDLMNSPDVANNPYVQQMLGQQVGANTDAFAQNAARFQQTFGRSLEDIGNTLTREWLPSIDSGASLAGQYGGTRQGVAQGVAMGDATKALSRAVGEGMTSLGDYGSNAARSLSSALAGTQLGAYGQGLSAQQNAMTMAPQIAQLGMLPGQIYQGVGTQLDAFRQAQIDAEKARWDYGQNQNVEGALDAERRALANYGLQTDWQRDSEARALQNYNLMMGQLQAMWNPLNQQSSIYGGFPASTQTVTGPQPGLASGLLGGASMGQAFAQSFPGMFGGSISAAPAPYIPAYSPAATTAWTGLQGSLF